MGSPPYGFLRKNIRFFKFFMVLFLSCFCYKTNLCSKLPPASQSSLNLETPAGFLSLEKLHIDGYFSFVDVDFAASDFGNMSHKLPLAILYPQSVLDISTTIKLIFGLGTYTELTVAARGHGHSLHGQAQASRGVVINMESLREPEMKVYTGKPPYVDVSGGELWINVLNETLKYGLAPKSWTDYLHLTIGGTLSNAGISGQAFRHGPQINNVYQLEVVTGKGDIVTCSEKHHADLFYAVLGGLGQFGIITRARIALEPAPQLVKVIRALYPNFSSFAKDEEELISLKDAFDYIEGFALVNRTDLLKDTSFNPDELLQASQSSYDGRTLYRLEVAAYFNADDRDATDEKINSLLPGLNYIPSTLDISEVSYLEFLERVHDSETQLRKQGLWEVPHPWLCLLIPKSKIHIFTEEVFGNILESNNNGPILIYPVNKFKWIKNTSLVTPDEDEIYLVSLLPSAVPSLAETDGLNRILAQNKRILEFCETAQLGVKQYLGRHSSQPDWQAHFGNGWEVFKTRKLTYDPLAILAPGHGIFQKGIPIY
ncbi:cytokinin dehydrogenase 1-like [Malania oleifera]|uniref:cytokinin dehydrogenase 1-like n=1 Tax=Malania oleifera TaxID=397392 RepID=UPI0025ADF212|nr:cytokinin dehydrogenase 1-like [Malania oleifera]